MKYTAFLVLSYGSKTSLSHGGFRGFRWSFTRLCNILMISPRWQFINRQYSAVLPLYSIDEKWSPSPFLLNIMLPTPPPRFSTPSLYPTNNVWSSRIKYDSSWYFKNSLLRHLLHVETHARKLTILGCLSPPKDFPNSISCANDSCSWSEQLPVIIMCRHRNR